MGAASGRRLWAVWLRAPHERLAEPLARAAVPCGVTVLEASGRGAGCRQEGSTEATNTSAKAARRVLPHGSCLPPEKVIREREAEAEIAPPGPCLSRGSAPLRARRRHRAGLPGASGSWPPQCGPSGSWPPQCGSSGSWPPQCGPSGSWPPQCGSLLITAERLFRAPQIDRTINQRVRNVLSDLTLSSEVLG